MAKIKIYKWYCNSCPESEPCISFGVSKPFMCPYGTDESINWKIAKEPKKMEIKCTTQSHI
jgi:hypothetical protein